VLLVLGCLYHMAAVVAFNLPAGTAHGMLRRPFAWYNWVAWVNQSWGMFTTAPSYAALDPALVARFADGSSQRFGPMLPELSPFPGGVRATYLVVRTLYPQGYYTQQIASYLGAACQAIAERTRQRPLSVQLEVNVTRLNSLRVVRETRQLGRPAVESSEVHTCRW
jgi:hypothetical protein